MEKEDVFNYIKHFDNVFGTNLTNTIDENKLILFLMAYEKIREELTTPTEEYLKMQKEKNKILENLKQNFNNEQKEIFNDFLDLDIKTKDIYNKQTIIFEYILTKILL